MDNFPIRILAEKTGVAPTTLRAWERRYGLLKPERTPKGHRLYSNQDVQTVRQIVDLLNENYTISKAINRIRIDEMQEQVEASQDQSGNMDHWVEYQNYFLTAIEKFDDHKLDNIYSEALSLYPVDLVSTQILRPIMIQLGERWKDREMGIAEEHFFTSFLRNKLGARMHHATGNNRGSRLLLACLPGEFHELGSLLFGMSAMSRGYRLLFLGADLPLEQAALVASATNVNGIILSAVTVSLRGQLARELDEFASSLNLPVMLGGSASNSSSLSSNDNLIILGNDYREALDTLEKTVPAYR